MGAPPVVVGLLVALLLWRNGPFGGLGWMYSLEAMVLAQVVIALPLVVGITLAAVIAALGGILSEVGANMQVGGNLEGETRVLTTSILMYTQMGDFEAALGLAAQLLGITLVLAALLTVVQQSGRT